MHPDIHPLDALGSGCVIQLDGAPARLATECATSTPAAGATEAVLGRDWMRDLDVCIMARHHKVLTADALVPPPGASRIDLERHAAGALTFDVGTGGRPMRVLLATGRDHSFTRRGSMPPDARRDRSWHAPLQFGSLHVAVPLAMASDDEEMRLVLDGVEACAGFDLLRELNVLVSLRNRACFVWPAAQPDEPAAVPRRRRS